MLSSGGEGSIVPRLRAIEATACAFVKNYHNNICGTFGIGGRGFFGTVKHAVSVGLIGVLANVCSGVTAQQCPVNMEWTECVSSCGSTCESLSVVGSAGTCGLTAADCLPGCQCREGTVYDRSAGAGCVAPSDCSCRYKGAVYSSQSTITVDCNEWSVYTKRLRIC